jgi:hypothetical protein
MLELQPLEIERPPEVEVRYATLAGAGYVTVLVVSVSGVYPAGSAGNIHASWIAVEVLRGLAAFDPCCVVLDFRELEYSYGDAILKVFGNIDRFMSEPAGAPFPVFTVTGEKSRAGFRSLLEPKWHYSKLEKALAAAGRVADAME